MAENSEILLIGGDKRDLITLVDLLKEVISLSIWKTNNYKESIELHKQRKFPLVIIDLMFSLKNTDLVKKLMSTAPSTSIIIATNYNLISKAITFMEEGAFGYITKPFNASEVRIVLEHALEHFYLKGADKEKKHYLKLSIIDGLTGVYNVRHLWEILDEEIRKAGEYPNRFSVLMTDLDDFKKYNDTNGHQAGDKLLKDFSELIGYSIRRGDMSFRYGGEEFVIFLPNTERKEAHLIAERVLGFVRLHLSVTVSMGLASFPEDGVDAKALIKKADNLLYKAKSSGKDRVCLQ